MLYNKLAKNFMLAKAIGNLSIASIVLLSLFVVASIVQLVFAFLEKEKYRRIEKPFCLALLTAFVAVTLPNHPFIYLATFAGMLGDIFVILPNKKFFYLGAFTFFLGFVFYGIEGLSRLYANPIPYYMIIVMVATYVVMVVVFGFFIGPRITNNNMGDSVGIGLYLSPIFTLITIFSFLTSKVGYFMFLSLIGIIVFLSSDLTITYTKFIKKFKRYDFYIMGTYLIGQLLIVLGFVLTYLAK